MEIKRIVQKGLAHHSYLIGDGNDYVAIDPCADIAPYLDFLRSRAGRLSAIIETHRNEDILSGSARLAAETGATVYLSAYDPLAYDYGQPINEDDRLTMGTLSLRVLHTPGHTKGHIAVVAALDGVDLAVFTGDALFYGDVGRSDFYPDEIETMTETLYQSIWQKILPLGDHVLVYPAHGPGSACGVQIEERELSTIGFEKAHHPLLQLSQAEFVKQQAVRRYLPDYFRKMEQLNLQADRPAVSDFLPKIKQAVGQLFDLRAVGEFLRAHDCDSFHLPVDEVNAYLPFLIQPEADLSLLVADTEATVKQVALTLKLMGYDHCYGYVTELASDACQTQEIRYPDYVGLKDKPGYGVLDVRKPSEIEVELPEVKYIPLQELRQRYQELDPETHWLVLCGSGRRALIALGFLEYHGYQGSFLRGGYQTINSQTE